MSLSVVLTGRMDLHFKDIASGGGTGAAPSAIAVDPTDHAVFVANAGNNTVSEIAESNSFLVATIPGRV